MSHTSMIVFLAYLVVLSVIEVIVLSKDLLDDLPLMISVPLYKFPWSSCLHDKLIQDKD